MVRRRAFGCHRKTDGEFQRYDNPMLTRRGFAARIGIAAAASRMLPEMAYAQRAAVNAAGLPSDVVWLNANENPAGIPDVALAAMREALPGAFRYHYQEFSAIYAAIAHSEDLAPEQIITGCGSSEVLHTAVDAFTSPTRPLISVTPAYEGPIETARSLGRNVILVKLRADYTADVHALAAEADKAGGGVIYLCNPNNPTSAFTAKSDVDWLVANLPPKTILLMDEAYLDFGDAPELVSAMPHVRQGKDVIVTRTFSKIYGMAGMRVGFAAAKREYIEKLQPLRMNVVSIVSARGVAAALEHRQSFIPERKKAMSRTRSELTAWLNDRKVGFIPPQANFIMIDCGRPAREFIAALPKLGVVPGRPFPPLDNMMRVTIGTDAEMSKFRDAFWKVYKG
jgi:histidinol-phosphate aminotransferase